MKFPIIYLSVLVLLLFGVAVSAQEDEPTNFIIFVGIDSEGGDTEIYRVDVDGNNLKQLTDNNLDDYSPAYNSEYDEVVFVRYDDAINRQDLISITLNSDSGEVNLTQNLATTDHSDPAFSPDGKLLAYIATSADDDYTDIYTRDREGQIKRLTTSADVEFSPQFSSDSDLIVFKQLTDHSNETDLGFVWSDGSEHLVYSAGHYWEFPFIFPAADRFITERQLEDGSWTVSLATTEINDDGSSITISFPDLPYLGSGNNRYPSGIYNATDDSGGVMYSSDRNGNWDIYGVGFGPGMKNREQQFTTDAADDLYPLVSLDDQDVVWLRNNHLYSLIYPDLQTEHRLSDIEVEPYLEGSRGFIWGRQR